MWRVQTSVNRAFVTLWIVFQTITLLQSAIVNTTRLVTITSSTQWKKLPTITYSDTNNFPTTTALRNGSPVIVTSPSSERVALSEKKSKANYNSSSNSNVFLSKHSDFEKLVTKTLEAQKNSQLSASIPTDGNGTVKIEKISKTTLATSSLSIISNKMRNMEISGSSVGGGMVTLATFPRSRQDAVKAKSTISIVDSKTQGAMSVYSKSSSIVMKNAKSAKIPSRSFSVLESSKTINSLNRTFGKGESLAKDVIDSTVQTTSLPQANTKISGRSGIAISSFIPEIIFSSQALVTTTNSSPLIATTAVPQLVARTDVPLLDTIKSFSSLVITTDVTLLSAKTPVSALFATSPPSLVTSTSAPLLVTITDGDILVTPMITTEIGIPLVKTTPDPISIKASATPLVATTTYSSSFTATHTADLGMHASLKSSGMMKQSISSNHSLSSVTNMTQYIPGIIHSKVTASPMATTTTYPSSFNATHTADLEIQANLKSSTMMKHSISSNNSLSSATNMIQDIPGIIHGKVTTSPMVTTTTYSLSFNATQTADLEIHASLKPSAIMKQSLLSIHSLSSVPNMTQDIPGIIHSKVTASPRVTTTTYTSSFNATQTTDLGMHSSLKLSGMMKQSISSSHSLLSVLNMTQYIQGIIHSKVTVSTLVAPTTYYSSFNATQTAGLGMHSSLKSSGMMKQSISFNHSFSSVSNMTQNIPRIIHSKVTASPLVATKTYSSSFNATQTADLGMHSSLKSSAMMEQSISPNHSLSSVSNMTQYIPGIIHSKITVKEPFANTTSATPLVTTTTYSSSFNATHTADLGMHSSLKPSTMMKQSISSNRSLASVTNMTQDIPGIIHGKVTASPMVATTTYSTSFNATQAADLGMHSILKPSTMMKQSISSNHSLSSVTNMTQDIPGIIYGKITASPMVTTTTYSSSFNATQAADLGMRSSLKSSAMMKQSISFNHSLSRVTNMTQDIPSIIHSQVTASPMVATTTYSSSFNATHIADLRMHSSLKSSGIMKQSISSNHSHSGVSNMTQYIPGIIHSKVTASPLVATATYSTSFNATHTSDLGMHSSLKPSTMMKQSISPNHSLSSVTNMTQDISGIIYGKITASPLVTRTTYSSSFNATQTADLGMHSSLKSPAMMKQSISSNHSFSSISNLTQYIPGIIHSKVTVKEPLAKTTSASPLVVTTGHYLSSNARHTATIMITPEINPSTSMTSQQQYQKTVFGKNVNITRHVSFSSSIPTLVYSTSTARNATSISNIGSESSFKLARSYGFTTAMETTPGNRTVNNVEVQETLSKPTLTLYQFAENITISTSSATSTNITITLTIKKDINIKYATASYTTQGQSHGKNFTSLQQTGVPVLRKTFGVASSSTYNYAVSGKSTSIKSVIHKESLSRPISSVSSILPSRKTISFHRNPTKTRSSSIISTTIESKMNISVAAIVSTLIVSSVRKTTEKEIKYSTMVPSENTTPLRQEFHVTFKITSEDFTNALSRESSKEFQEKRREIENMFDRAYKNFPGYIYSKVRRFYKGSIGCCSIRGI